MFFKTGAENEMLDIKISGLGLLSRKEAIKKPVNNAKSDDRSMRYSRQMITIIRYNFNVSNNLQNIQTIRKIIYCQKKLQSSYWNFAKFNYQKRLRY